MLGSEGGGHLLIGILGIEAGLFEDSRMTREDREKIGSGQPGLTTACANRHHLQDKNTVAAINLIFDTHSLEVPIGHMDR